MRGLAFAPKGYRLAFSHYNGASLWFPNAAEPPQPLEWKGSHLDVAWSPDGRFVVTTMQENAMHGWRVSDSKHMRMSGYPAKPRSLSWSPDGSWLATSGAEACVVWPFEGKDGPMGKPPRECGVRPVRVSQVAFHPRAGVLALGYDDGFVLMVRMKDNSEILVRREDEAGGAVSALGLERGGDAARLRHPQRRRGPADPADLKRKPGARPGFPHHPDWGPITWPCASSGDASCDAWCGGASCSSASCRW